MFLDLSKYLPGGGKNCPHYRTASWARGTCQQLSNAGSQHSATWPRALRRWITQGCNCPQTSSLKRTERDSWSSPHGTTRSTSVQCWDAGSIPGSLASQHSGLRVQHCHSCHVGCNCSSDLIPGPGIPYAAERQKKRERERDSYISRYLTQGSLGMVKSPVFPSKSPKTVQPSVPQTALLHE